MNRDSILQKVQSRAKPFDILVVGGGATGLGTALDAAARGYDTLLIEQSDFCKGTSSRSTKLVHGGVRYLQQGNIRLVLDALKERGLMRRNAPHLVHDLAFVIPTYKWWHKPFYGIGMIVYDRLAGKLGFGRSKMLSKQETIRCLPTVETNGLKGGVIYHDGQFDDSRLAVNLAQTAFEHGASLLNYVKCTGLLTENGRITGATVRDEETGESFEIKAKSVVNATGMYVDDLIEFDTGKPSKIVAVSQGIHIVLPKEFLPEKWGLMIPKTEDGRVLFGVPWHDCVVVGTTDTPLNGKSLEPRALEEERDFVMSHARKYLAKDPTDNDVLSVFAGLRPLVRRGESSKTAALSRDHTILVSDSGLVSVAGGKWTTYRKMGEDVVDHAEKVANFSNRPCKTESLAIRGSAGSAAAKNGLEVYGSDAQAIQDLMDASPDLAEKLHPALPYRKAEVVWAAREEMARTVEDVLSRRTRALLLNAKASIEAAPEAARLLGAELGKDDQWVREQTESYTELARRYVFTDKASVGSKE